MRQHASNVVPGHLFIIDRDLTKLACDAILAPIDVVFKIEPRWDHLLDGQLYPHRGTAKRHFLSTAWINLGPEATTRHQRYR